MRFLLGILFLRKDTIRGPYTYLIVKLASASIVRVKSDFMEIARYTWITRCYTRRCQYQIENSRIGVISGEPFLRRIIELVAVSTTLEKKPNQ